MSIKSIINKKFNKKKNPGETDESDDECQENDLLENLNSPYKELV